MRSVDWWLVVALTGCSSGLPASLPPASAASENAVAAPLPVVARALREDPSVLVDAGSAMPPMPGM